MQKKAIISTQSEDINSYLKRTELVSDADIIEFLKSPLHYFEKKRDELKTNQKLGEAIIHCALEPETMMFDYVSSPKFDMRKPENKLAAAEFFESNPNKVILFPSEQEIVQYASAKCIQNHLVSSMLEKCEYGRSFFSKDESTGIHIKLRPSGARHPEISFEVRLSMYASPDQFMTDVEDFQLAVSAAMHIDFMNVKRHVFLAVDKASPHYVAAYELTDKMIIAGRKKYRMALDIMKWCQDHNHWCNYNEFEVLKLYYDTTGDINHFTTDMLKTHSSTHIVGSSVKEQLVKKYPSPKPVEVPAKAKAKKPPVKSGKPKYPKSPEIKKVTKKASAKASDTKEPPKPPILTTKTTFDKIVKKMDKKPLAISKKEKERANTPPVFPDLFTPVK